MRILLIAVLLVASSAAQQLTAGDVDDHLNWDHYLGYLDKLAADQSLPSFDMDDRITVRVENATGVPMPMVTVSVGGLLPDQEFVAGADGVVRLLPAVDNLSGDITISARQGLASDSKSVAVGGDQEITLVLDAVPIAPAALDIMFVIDTTGSMGDELAYLTQELENIVESIHALGTDLRLGLTVYRDHGDDYVVREFGFTSDVQEMRNWLADQRAAGGGDYPEAMDEALEAAVSAQWRADAVKLLFLVADAPPHQQGYAPFVDAAKAARAAGIHIHGVAGSGVADEAEYLMRAAAAMTQGRYAFLTDDSGIGNSHAEPTIPCYVVTHLDDLLLRIAQSEFTGIRVEAAPGDVLREVGDYQQGVCLSVEPQDQQGTGGSESSGSPGTSSDSAYSEGAVGATPPSTPPAPPSVPPTDGTGRSGDDASIGDEASDGSKDTPGPAAMLVLAMLVLLAGRRRNT